MGWLHLAEELRFVQVSEGLEMGSQDGLEEGIRQDLVVGHMGWGRMVLDLQGQGHC